MRRKTESGKVVSSHSSACGASSLMREVADRLAQRFVLVGEDEVLAARVCEVGLQDALGGGGHGGVSLFVLLGSASVQGALAAAVAATLAQAHLKVNSRAIYFARGRVGKRGPRRRRDGLQRHRGGSRARADLCDCTRGSSCAARPSVLRAPLPFGRPSRRWPRLPPRPAGPGAADQHPEGELRALRLPGGSLASAISSGSIPLRPRSSPARANPPPRRRPRASSAGCSAGTTIQSRTIGGSEYTYDPEAAEFDRRRPWVEEGGPRAEEAGSLVPGGLLENDQTRGAGHLQRARRRAEHGPGSEPGGAGHSRRSAGDRVRRQAQPRAPDRAAEELARASPQSPGARCSHSPGRRIQAEGASASAVARPWKRSSPQTACRCGCGPRSSTKGSSIAVRVDTLQINVPVQVSAPPAKSTITEAKLLKIERRRAKRELAHALRACSRESGRRAARCRTLAQLSHRVPGGWPSPRSRAGKLLARPTAAGRPSR